MTAFKRSGASFGHEIKITDCIHSVNTGETRDPRAVAPMNIRSGVLTARANRNREALIRYGTAVPRRSCFISDLKKRVRRTMWSWQWL